MTIIATFLAAHLAAIIPWLIGAGGVLFGVLRHQQAKTATAKAAATVAQAQASVAQGDAAAALAGQQDAANKAAADQQAAAIPDANLDAQLNQLGALRKD
ncbi:hypothetical protein [Paraburkholderia silvatlantica]|uniref:Uncharacterized protein n=1 Tax=Paraburkholderia silvatlantica TaxID=321895 RepID=A0ABR6FLU5_9BURK|nr:hypothetical protein [Paraburkholderia silvatlantica]MBB2928403.1 hypothetical protein [Paraburkholderia silvatlantica]PVY34552.1 hypothetical protein C7411_10788 [Paraburkholderia silvatlantica]PXW38767.1 hypothetical protein C7413_10788 [Paraburkholderia silvatlantica]